MPIGDILDTTVGDLEIPGKDIKYPLSPAMLKDIKFLYDLHVKKKGCRWVYVDSTNTISRWKKHKDTVESKGGGWRIVESATAKIVEEGGNSDA